MFSLLESQNKKRIGKIQTKSGVVATPFFMPVATKGALKHLDGEEIKKIGYELVLSNTYHLWLRPGDELIKQSGGLHKFMNWDGSILTDSGGFQVFSLGARATERFGVCGVELSSNGVHFVDPINGKKHFLSPEKAVQIQLNIGTDIIMCLDVCPPYPCSKREAQESLELTTVWAKRCKKYFDKKTKDLKTEEKPLLFGIVQGSTFEDLRKESAKQIVDIGFDGYAIGGVAVGEPREKLGEILKWILPFLPENKPRYLMGLGKPEEIVASVTEGVDMFDCVIPSREGRHGRLFCWSEDSKGEIIELSDKPDFYKTINIGNSKFKKDFKVVDSHCSCPLCKNYSRAYIRHLFAVNEPFAGRLASLHNLTFYFDLIKKLRKTKKQ
ncbi:MAG: tRNA guanosine(34) transglycosylase Tgt [Patescibacteria group bacterium]|nr:tRNA guanosine(34) transglycosylase Tgt [Patescibacteria group bacterium]